MKETIGLMLEVTSHCNMHCTFCPSDDLVRTKGHVSNEQAIQFILAAHEMAPGKSIMFNVLGEPFLNKKLFDYIALCEEHDIPASMFTNITLLNEERLKKLYKYRNVHLDMSLHTPTDKSFAERGYQKIKNFREYLDMVCNAIEARYRYKSNAKINIYLASELTPNLMQNDGGERLWTLFDDAEEYSAGWNLCAEMFSELGARIQRDYPEAFAAEMEIVKHAYQQQIQAGEIVFRAEDLPPWRLEQDTSGWICVPGVIVRRKGFGMWGYHEQFVKRHAQANGFTFQEERTEPFQCPGASAFGILSDGTYTLCCQDVEGQNGHWQHCGHGSTHRVCIAAPRGNYRELRDLTGLPPLCWEHHDSRHSAGSRRLTNRRQIWFRLACISNPTFFWRGCAMDCGRREFLLLHAIGRRCALHEISLAFSFRD